MRVLGIVGSVRRGGNTEILVREALDGAKEKGVDTDIVLAADTNIIPCNGCNVCRQKGICPIKDDMQHIYKQMETADAILLGSPVYFHSVSSQAKAIIDRTNLFLFNQKLKRKVGAPIVVMGKSGGVATRNLLLDFFIIHEMIPLKGTIGSGFAKGDVKQGAGGRPNLTALEDARATGWDVVRMVQSLKKTGG